ncbi:MAG: hypothetical protein ABFS19_07570 [Thermodesulfobacteriota bacterium]
MSLQNALRHIALTGFIFLFSVTGLHSAEDEMLQITLKGAVAQEIAEQITAKDIEIVGTLDVELYDPFDKKKSLFTTVKLEEFVARFGKPGVTEVTFKAIDDYSLSFNKKDWTEERILIATQSGNKYMTLEKKGPIRILFPGWNRKNYSKKRSLPKWIWMITEVQFR